MILRFFVLILVISNAKAASECQAQFSLDIPNPPVEIKCGEVKGWVPSETPVASATFVVMKDGKSREVILNSNLKVGDLLGDVGRNRKIIERLNILATEKIQLKNETFLLKSRTPMLVGYYGPKIAGYSPDNATVPTETPSPTPSCASECTALGNGKLQCPDGIYLKEASVYADQISDKLDTSSPSTKPSIKQEVIGK